VACDVIATDGSVGGGAFPTARIPSAAVALSGDAERHDARLRAAEPPVVGRIVDGRMVLDLRAIPPTVDNELPGIVHSAVT
jgi:L-seryl-tRNA(Ser) seleniumtransferase